MVESPFNHILVFFILKTSKNPVSLFFNGFPCKDIFLYAAKNDKHTDIKLKR